ncbi:MAG: hypothetical protein ACP5OR_04275 [Candidatus Dormibacteria bacterium]
MTVFRHLIHSGMIFLKQHVLGAVISAGLIATGTGAVAAIQLTGAAAPASTVSQSTTHHRNANNARRRIAFRLLIAFAHEIHSSPITVIGDLKKGESLDTIAGSQASTVQSQLVARYTKYLDTLVAKGKITSQQEQTRSQAFSSKLNSLMQEPGTKLLAQIRAFLRPGNPHSHAHGHGLHPSPSAIPGQSAAA